MNINRMLFWIFMILGIILVIWYFVGDSPTLEQALLIFILGMLFKQNNSINSNKYSIKGLIKRVDKLEK